jgi:hypothetical protein
VDRHRRDVRPRTHRGRSALYQQRPSPAGGAIFKRSWFKTFRDLGDAYEVDATVFAAAQCRRFATCDPAITIGTQSDYTAASPLQASSWRWSAAKAFARVTLLVAFAAFSLARALILTEGVGMVEYTVGVILVTLLAAGTIPAARRSIRRA